MNEKNNKPFVLAVVGPTASGKTWLGVELAKIYGGEVIYHFFSGSGSITGASTAFLRTLAIPFLQLSFLT